MHGQLYSRSCYHARYFRAFFSPNSVYVRTVRSNNWSVLVLVVCPLVFSGEHSAPFSPSPSELQLQRRRAEAVADGLHPAAGPGAGEGVPLQPLPDAQAQGGDRAHALPVRTADQNLVPEPEDEMEEGSQASQHQGPLRVKQYELPGSDWLPKPQRTPIAARVSVIYAPSLAVPDCETERRRGSRASDHRSLHFGPE